MKIDKRDILIGVTVSIFVLMTFIFFKFFSVSSGKILSYPINMPEKFINLTTNYGVFYTVRFFLLDFLSFLAPFIPLSISLSILAIYGAKFGENKKLGIVSTTIPIIIGLFFIGFSLTSILFSFGVIFSGILSTGFSEMHSKELKKWRNFRIGSHTVGKCFLIINVLLLFGLFLTSFLSLDYYTDSYKSGTKSMLIGFMPDMGGDLSQMEGYEELPDEQKQLIEQQYQEQLNEQKNLMNEKIDSVLNSDKMTALLYFSILLIPFFVFSILEFLRNLVFSPLAGLITKIGLMEVKKQI